MQDKKESEEEIIAHAKEELEKEKTLKLSVKEGCATSVMSGFGDSYISPFALALGANNAQIGLLSSFPSLISPLTQIAGSRLMEKVSRRRLIIISVTLHALMWLPMLVLGLFFMGNLFTSSLPIMLILFYSLYAIFGALAGPAWFSLLGDLIPEHIRGKYISKRNEICGAVALVSMIIAAFVLDFFKTRGFLLIGFSILFLIASIFRLVSANLFRKHYYPELKLEKGYYFSIWQFIKKAPSNNFGRFVIYVALMNLATSIAGPFFAVYMLRDLGFSYAEYMLTNIIASLTTILFLPLLGKFSDKYGNRELLRFGSALTPLIPILWLVSSSHWYIILVPQLISGLGWGAFNFAASNFIYDQVTPQRRGICVAYFNVIVGIGIFIGASLGGLLTQYLHLSFMNTLLFIFLVSGILRYAVSLLIPIVKEVKEVKEPKSVAILYFKEISPKGAIYGILHDLKSIGRIFKKRQ